MPQSLSTSLTELDASATVAFHMTTSLKDCPGSQFMTRTFGAEGTVR
jgi:hypothetical protein